MDEKAWRHLFTPVFQDHGMKALHNRAPPFHASLYFPAFLDIKQDGDKTLLLNKLVNLSGICEVIHEEGSLQFIYTHLFIQKMPYWLSTIDKGTGLQVEAFLDQT